MKRSVLPLIIVILALSAGLGVLSADFGDDATFTYQIGGPVPFPQFFSVVAQRAGGQAMNLGARTSGQPWIQATLSSTVTPSTLTVSVSPVGLAPGFYFATVEV